MKDVERRDLPTGSSLHRYSLCKISYQLGLLSPPSKYTKYSKSGTRGHKALYANNLADLSRDELDTVELAKEREGYLLDSLLDKDVPREEIRESRLFYKETGEPIYTVMPDVVYVADDEYKTGVLLDYKLGYMEVPPSSRNLQLRGGAVAVWQNYGCQRIYTSIIQPNGGHWYTPALYELSDLQAARDEIKQLMVDIHSPDAQANPSAEACRHCPAKLICKAAYSPSTQISTRQKDVVVTLGDRDLSEFGTLALQAEIIIKAAKEELKARIMRRPDDFPDWYLQPTGSQSSVDDSQAAYARFQDLLSDKEFSKICKPSITGLTDLVRTITGMSKHSARIEVEGRLAELLIKKAKEPSLKRKQVWETEVTENGRLEE